MTTITVGNYFTVTTKLSRSQIKLPRRIIHAGLRHACASERRQIACRARSIFWEAKRRTGAWCAGYQTGVSVLIRIKECILIARPIEASAGISLSAGGDLIVADDDLDRKA